MGGALVTKRVVSYCQIEARLHGICSSLRGKICLTSCTLLTRWSASVLKVGVPCGCEAYKTRLAYSVTLMHVKRPLGRLINPEKKKEAARKIYYVNSKLR